MPVDDLVIGRTVFGSAFLRINGSLRLDTGTVESISSFGEDNDSNLYIVSILGDVFRIEAEQP